MRLIVRPLTEPLAPVPVLVPVCTHKVRVIWWVEARVTVVRLLKPVAARTATTVWRTLLVRQEHVRGRYWAGQARQLHSWDGVEKMIFNDQRYSQNKLESSAYYN